MRFLNTILDIIFPPKCLLCKKEGPELCLGCIREAPSAERESAKSISPIFDYRHPGVKKALWLLKYTGKKRLAKIFAEIIYDKILEELSELSVLENFTRPILIPIPLSRKRRRERGFNQAELICRALLELSKERDDLEIEMKENILIKPRETEHQARIKDRHERLKNIAGSFALKNAEDVRDRNIILIDDILTTGATLTEAKKILKQAGAKKIIAFTVAH